MPRTPTVHYDKNRDRHYFTVNGKKYVRKNYADAVELLTDLTAVQQRSGNVECIAEMVELWFAKNRKKDHETNRWRLKPWWQFEGDVSLQSFGRDGLDRYLEHLKNNTDYAPKTIRDMMTIAGQVCRWAFTRNHLPDLPLVPRLPKAPIGKKSIPVKKLARMFERFNSSKYDRVRSILEFIQGTGCRPIEARRLIWDEVDLEEGLITLDPNRHKTGKITGEPITIFIDRPHAPEIRQALLGAAKRDGMDGLVFRSRLGKPYTASGLRSITKRAGFNPYALRHTVVQDGIDQGQNPEDLGSIVGHKDPATTRLYGQIKNRRAAEAAKRLTSPLQRGRALNSVPADKADQEARQSNPRKLANAG